MGRDVPCRSRAFESSGSSVGFVSRLVATAGLDDEAGFR